MEYLVKNPGGRIVAVKNEEAYNDWLKKPGFSEITEEERRKYYTDREAKFALKEEEIDYEDGVYFSTVTQGGTDGYGITSKNIFSHLKSFGAKPSYNYVDQKVGFLYHAPYNMPRLETPIKILYTMFESDKIPDEWMDYLSMADKILVPSKWCQRVFADSGVTTEVVPLGYDDSIFRYVPREYKRGARKDFVFLHYNAFNKRKGFSELFKAFVQEFEPSEPVKLILKTTQDKSPIPLHEYKNIEVVTGKIPDDDLMKLMARSDAFVFPSMGEGFGLTPLEAMATGLPTIVPNAHGISEYFNNDCMYEVKVAEYAPALYHRYKGQDVGRMVKCDIGHLRRQMRFIYEHQEQAMAIGKKASEYVKQYTIKNTAQQLYKIIESAKGWRPKQVNVGKVLVVKTI